MLQQTQVVRVMLKYPEFIKKFPGVSQLAHASVRSVLAAWSGLGYNRRALYLKRTAERVMKEYGGKLPSDQNILKTLPGIGANTAGAIAAFAFNKPVPFIETNIRRAFIHHFFSKRRKISDKEVLEIAENVLPSGKAREWHWALMDYGHALALTLPKGANPNRRSKHYAKQASFAGSDRELRGKIIRLLVVKKRMSRRSLVAALQAPPPRAWRILHELVQEGFLERRSATYAVRGA
jgi:A/G-specific adenine glycosylase